MYESYEDKKNRKPLTIQGLEFKITTAKKINNKKKGCLSKQKEFFSVLETKDGILGF